MVQVWKSAVGVLPRLVSKHTTCLLGYSYVALLENAT